MNITSTSLDLIAGECADYLKKMGVDCPKISADLLIGQVLGLSKLEMILRPRYELSEQECGQIKELIERRAQGEPVAYILGRKEFFGLELKVDSQVLIPRPETEELVYLVRELFAAEERFLFADLGTGSGAIALALLNEFENCKGLLVDLSLKALNIAFCNAYRFSERSRYQVVQADLASSLKPLKFDLIVANPPYLIEDDFQDLDIGVSRYEPRQALLAGKNRADVHTAIARQAYWALKPKGWLLMEMDYRQKDLKEIAFDSLPDKWSDSFVRKDLAGLDRVIAARKVV